MSAEPIDDYSLETLDSCLLLEVNESSLPGIDKSSFEMAGGDVLSVGDKFTAIDERGSAGLPPITLADGWYQQYVGTIQVNSVGFADNHVLTLRLFEAFKVDSGESATAKFSSQFECMYLAYIDSGTGGMSYWNSCGSGRRVKCQSITRWRS